MIYFLNGTKAQLIKMFPLMQRLRMIGVAYQDIDTVQHGPICERLRERLQLPAPTHYLAPRGTQIEGTLHAVFWALAVLWRGWRRRREIFPERGVVLVHGDTLSTLIGLLLAKLCGQKVCHVEAGERTHRLLRPFPEEIIRRFVDRRSDLLLACGDTQYNNIVSAGIARPARNLGHNTLLDAVVAVGASARASTAGDARSEKPPVLVSVHRFETITSRQRMTFLVDSLEQLAKSNRVVFGLHPPTRRKLEEFGLLTRLTGYANIELRGLLDYPDFIAAIANSKFLYTDGGGPQEESYFLGVPCLLLRSETERSHPNVRMAEWNIENVLAFDKNSESFRRPPLNHDGSPSELAVDAILKEFHLDQRPTVTEESGIRGK